MAEIQLLNFEILFEILFGKHFETRQHIKKSEKNSWDIMNVVSHTAYSKVVTILSIIHVKLFIHTAGVKVSPNKKKYAKILPNLSPKINCNY